MSKRLRSMNGQPIDVENAAFYDVRKIVSKRVTTDEDGEDTVEYLVEWEPTWMSAEEAGEHESVHEFETKSKKRPRDEEQETSMSLTPATTTSELEEFKVMIRVGVEPKDLQKTAYGRKLYDKVLGCMYFGVSTTERAKMCMIFCSSQSYASKEVAPRTGICGACNLYRTLSWNITGYGNVGSDCARRADAAHVLFASLRQMRASKEDITINDMHAVQEKLDELLTEHALSAK